MGWYESIHGENKTQIMVSIVILGTIAYYGIEKELTEITVGCIAGIIALAKDVLQSDAD
jgi:hypothetical protein